MVSYRRGVGVNNFLHRAILNTRKNGEIKMREKEKEEKLLLLFIGARIFLLSLLRTEILKTERAKNQKRKKKSHETRRKEPLKKKWSFFLSFFFSSFLFLSFFTKRKRVYAVKTPTTVISLLGDSALNSQRAAWVTIHQVVVSSILNGYSIIMALYETKQSLVNKISVQRYNEIVSKLTITTK